MLPRKRAPSPGGPVRQSEKSPRKTNTTHMKPTFPRLLATLCAAGLMAGASALADDVTDQVDEAMKAYKEQDYSTAATNLEAAAQLIRQKRAESFTKFLPKPLSGWEAEDASTQAAGAAMFGGGVSAERHYSKGDSTITVKLLSDSPIMQGVMMMMSNPMFASSDGGKLETIKRQKAIVKYKEANKGGEINIVLSGVMLITIEGRDCTLADMKAYAEAIDFGGLAATL